MLVSLISEYMWLIFVLAAGAWAARLWQLKLTRRYPTLFCFLLFLATHSLVEHLLTLPPFRYPGAAWYRWFFFLSRPVWWLLSFLVVLEVYNRMLAGYRGFQRLGDLAKYGALGSVAVVICAIVVLDPVGAGPSTLAVKVVLLQQRAVYVALTTLCLILASFAAVFRLDIPKNVQHVFAVFGLMFSGFAVLDTLQAHIGNDIQAFRAIAIPVLYVASLVAGSVLFSPNGENAPVPAGSRSPLSAESEALTVGRLEGFNELLLKVLRS